MVLSDRASFAQERHFFLNRFQPGNPAYVVAFSLRLSGPLQVDALTEALHRVVARHDVLRTTYAVEGGRVVQRVHDELAPEIERRPATAADASAGPQAQERELKELVATESRRPFSLEQGPVLRAWIRSWGPRAHALTVLLPHAACDGWSVGLLLGELEAQYNAVTGGRAAPAGEAASYLAYARRQREAADAGALDDGLRFWRTALEGAPRLDLPTDFPRPAELGPAGRVLRLDIEPELVERLSGWAAERGATLFVVVLAAYADLLSRYARQQQLVVGVPVANRLDASDESLIGCLVNTVPVRIDLTGRPSFAELVDRCRAAWLTAFSHQDVPFEQIVRVAAADRQLSHAPLFQTLLTVQNYPFALPAFDGLTATEVDVEIEAAKFDLGLTLDLSAATPFLRVEYSTELFEAGTAAGLLGHYHSLLRSVVRDAEPDLVDAAERRVLLAASAPEHADGARLPAPDGFLARARTRPQDVALRSGGEQTRYGELEAWSGRIAAALAEAGVGAGDLVGVLLSGSAALAAAVLGVWRLGAALVALDPEEPDAWLGRLARHADLDVVLTDPANAGRARGLAAAGQIEVVDALGADGAAVALYSPEPEDLACLVYGPDAAGEPEGVRIQHAGITALTRAVPGEPEPAADDVWLSAHTPGDLPWLGELCAALVSGGSVVLPAAARPGEPERLAATALSERVTRIALPPELPGRFLPAYLELLGDGVSPLRLVAVDGGLPDWPALAAASAGADGLRAVFSGRFGPVEATGRAVALARPVKSLAELRPGELGTPAPSARCYVLDPGGRPCGHLVPGELHLGGPVLADGYLDDPERTGARFPAGPFGDGPLYRTGDLVRWSAEGTLVHLGRTDGRARLGGRLIRDDAVAAVLRRHPGVQDCAVTVHQDRLLAFVSGERLEQDQAGALRSLVAERLPRRLLPERILLVPAIGRDAEGRTDPERLLADGAPQAGPAVEAPVALPGGAALEEQIGLMWAQVLGVDEVGPHDNFFDLGGHSLAMIELQQLMAAAGLEFTVNDLFRFGTVASYAAHFRRQGESAHAGPSHTGPSHAGPEPIEQRRRGSRQLAARRREGGQSNG